MEKLRRFCAAALDSGAGAVLVAVNVDEDASDAVRLEWNHDKRVAVFPVTPWGRFVPALNAILFDRGREYWSTHNLMLASVEIVLTRDIAGFLNFHMTPLDNTLVVGAALQGHRYSRGGPYAPASGRQTPWNTLALWDPRILWANSGFHLLGEGPLGEPDNAGVEEVITIASIQQNPRYITSGAKLVEAPGIAWDTTGFDEARRAVHEKKMATKDGRSLAQLLAAGFRLGSTCPCVYHC